MTNRLQDSSIAKLHATFGKKRVWFDDSAKEHSVLPTLPTALLSVEKPSEICQAMSIAQSEKIPLVTRGLGTRIDSAACTSPSCLELDLRRMSGVEKINPDSLWVRAQAGTPLQQIARCVKELGLRIETLVEDEMSGTLGGFLSTHARIHDPITGVSQPVVLDVEALLPNGQSVRSVPAPRAAAGPDLFSLFLGTRGGLGVITSASLKLEPIPEKVQTLEWSFANLENALAFVHGSLHALLIPRQLQVYFGSNDSSVIVSLRLEGLSKMVGAALAQMRAIASRTNGSIIERQTRPNTQGQESQTHFQCETFVYWSMLFEVLQGVDKLFSGAWTAKLTDVDLTGPTLLINANCTPSSQAEEFGQRFGQLTDPHQRFGKAKAHAVAMFQKIRDDLDPDRLLNPHAWAEGL